MATSLFAKCEYKLRLVTFLNEVEEHLRYLFHHPNHGNFPVDKEQLYKIMVKLDNNGKLKHLLKHQRPLVLPRSKKTDSMEFDLSILCSLLLTSKKLTKSIRADIEAIRDERNGIIHKPRFNYVEYIVRWSNCEHIIQRLGYDITLIKDLKFGSLHEMEKFQVSINKSKIQIQEMEIKTNNNNIEQNKDDIEQNKDDIEKSKDDIEQNKRDIEQIEDHITQAESIIQSHDQRIQALERLNENSVKKSEVKQPLNKKKQITRR